MVLVKLRLLAALQPIEFILADNEVESFVALDHLGGNYWFAHDARRLNYGSSLDGDVIVILRKRHSLK